MDKSELNEVFANHRDRLKRMIDLRMDRRLAGRVDASDIIQESFIEAADRYDEFIDKDEGVSVFVWLRFLTVQKLNQVHRRHMEVKARSVKREVSVQADGFPEASSIYLAAFLADSMTSPSQAVAKKEAQARLLEQLEEMSPADREILALRHFEQLSNAEAAEVIEISQDACYRRYVRALKRIRTEIDSEE